jgi:hypothetical protein
MAQGTSFIPVLGDLMECGFYRLMIRKKDRSVASWRETKKVMMLLLPCFVSSSVHLLRSSDF